MDIVDIILAQSYTDQIVTGDVTITKNADGSITFSANGGNSTVTLSPDEVRGRGVNSAIVNNEGHLIVTYSDNTVEDLGLIKGKHENVSVKDNIEYKTTLELTNYDSNGNAIKETTPNLKPPKVTITESEGNTDTNYKLDVNTYDEDGNITKKVTTPNMKPTEYTIQPNTSNNQHSYKLDITKKDETGITTITSSNIKGNFIWNGTDLTGDSIVFEVLADDGINYSRVNDLYINTETADLYLRTDKRNVNNTWERIGNFKGLEGDDAYEVAISEGFVGTRSDWLKSLTGESLGSDIVFSKPNLYDEKTLLKKWYYYKVDNVRYGEGTAWYNRYNIPSNKDYPPNKYTFFNGINYLTFETKVHTIPALTNKDTHDFYVLYDEKLNKCVGHMVSKETGEDVDLGGWIDVTTSLDIPKDAELVENNGNVIQYGDWVQTIYIGSSKDNAKECTITTGVDVTGFVTSDEFNEVIGTDTLDTNNKDIKRAINELFGYLKTNKDTVLNTDNKTVFEAINELFGKHYMDCYELVDSDLLTHCLSLGYKTLSSNFIYCKNCTGVPIGNNGYGYAMLIVAQDTHYRQVVFFDPSTGKISSNNIGDNDDKTGFGNWSGWCSASDDLTNHTSDTNIHITTAERTKWNDKLSRTDIATTIDENSTDENPAGARAVYKRIKNMVTTTVPDVPKTDITSKVSNATVNYNSGVSYSVKNGICYVQFTSVTTTTATNGQYIVKKGTLPSIDNSLSNGRYPVVGGGAKSGMVAVDGNTGGVRYYGGEMTIFTTISYPVKEQ